MYFDRPIDAELRRWISGDNRKPLVLRGARQTGKTAAVRHLGAVRPLFVELNLERHADAALARSCRSADELLDAVAVRENVARLPDDALLFLDEIQAHPPAVAWLRELYEDHPELAVVAAGSLMEVRLRDGGFSFPVGRVTFRYLRPLAFADFLRATDRDQLADRLRRSAVQLEPLPPAVHDLALAALSEYVLVGGMPEAVTTWRESGSLSATRAFHGDLQQAFAEDFHKYGGVRSLDHVEAAFEALPRHYGSRFKYEAFSAGYRSARMKAALGKLEGAMLVRRVLPTSSTSAPIEVKARSAPKLLPLDLGLASSAWGLQRKDLSAGGLNGAIDGRAAEVFVGLELLAHALTVDSPLYFWVRESSRANSELDYLVPNGRELAPVEVKAGATGSLKSLHQFLWRAGASCGIRLSTGPLRDERHQVVMPDGLMEYRLLSLPLYLAGELTEVVEALATWNDRS